MGDGTASKSRDLRTFETGVPAFGWFLTRGRRQRLGRIGGRVAIVAAYAVVPILALALMSCRGVRGAPPPAVPDSTAQGSDVGIKAGSPQAAQVHQMLSPDVSVRRAAAASLDPGALSSADLRLQASVLAGDAEWLRTHLPGASESSTMAARQALALGHREYMTAVTTLILAVRPENEEATAQAIGALGDLARTGDIPALIALLPRCGEKSRRRVAWILENLSEGTRSYRVDLARTALEEVARDRREPEAGSSGASESAFDDGRARSPEGAGFAPEWRRLAAIAWELPERGPVARESACFLGNHWLRRWARDEKPGEADLTILAQIAGLYSDDSPAFDLALAPGTTPYYRDSVWAVRQIGRVDGPRATALLYQLCQCDDAQRLTALGVLARRGCPVDLEILHSAALSRDETLAYFGFIALWDAAPTVARSAAVEMCLAGTMDALTPYANSPYPSCREADRLADEEGVEISPDDLRWIGEELLRRGAPPVTVLLHFQGISRLGFSRPTALKLAPIVPIAADAPDDWRAGGSDEIVAVLAAIEAADPGVLRDLLRSWSRSAKDRGRLDDLLRWRKRIGDRGDETGAAGGAPRAKGWPDYGTPVPDPDVDAAAAGDASPETIAELGLRPDPRVRDVLQRIRAEGNPATMWSAVLGQARSGDEEARSEWRTLVRDGRMNIISEALGRIRMDVCDDQETLDAWTECLIGTWLGARVEWNTFCGQEPQSFGFVPSPDDQLDGDPVIDIERMTRLVRAGGLRRSRVSGALVSPSGERGK